jgi:hypothetical protein
LISSLGGTTVPVVIAAMPQAAASTGIQTERRLLRAVFTSSVRIRSA